jgi:hypothetical protein
MWLPFEREFGGTVWLAGLTITSVKIEKGPAVDYDRTSFRFDDFPTERSA